MNGFEMEANPVNRVSDSKKICPQSKSFYTDYEQLKIAVQFLHSWII
jgi:hypothetical protein